MAVDYRNQHKTTTLPSQPEDDYNIYYYLLLIIRTVNILLLENLLCGL